MIQFEQQDEPDELKTFCDVFQVLKQSSYVLYSEGVYVWENGRLFLNISTVLVASCFHKKKKKNSLM